MPTVLSWGVPEAFGDLSQESDLLGIILVPHLISPHLTSPHLISQW